MAMRCPCLAVRVLLPKTEPEPTSSGYLPPGVAARIAGGEVPQNVDGPVFDSSTGLTSQGIASRYEGLPNLIVSHCCQAFRVGEEGNGFVMDQRVLSSQTDSSEFRPARGASPCASTDPAATASSSVLPVKPRPYALGAMGAIRGARCPI